MNLRDIEYFLAVAELEHFGKAAQQCCVSQPTLSGQIKKLEETLGVALFERTNRRVMLTTIGKNLLLHARRILLEVDMMKDVAESASNPLAGKFRLGAFPTLSTYIFPSIVPKVKLAMPDLRLILIEEKTDHLIEQLRQGKIDAALLALPLQDDFLVNHALFDDEFVLAVPPEHPLSSSAEIEQSTLQSHRLLLLEEGHCLRDQSLDVCQLHGIAEEQDFKATGLETLRQMVKAGTGITFMPSIAMHPDEADICYIPFSAPAPYRTIGLVWRKTSPRLQVMNILTDIMQHL